MNKEISMRIAIAGLAVLLLASTARAEVYVRYDASNRRVKHVSTVPFTRLPASGESDTIVDSLPSDVRDTRLTSDLSSFEPDPAVAQDKAQKDQAQKDQIKSIKDKLTGLGFTNAEAMYLLR
jgi:hypothetical protein